MVFALQAKAREQCAGASGSVPADASQGSLPVVEAGRAAEVAARAEHALLPPAGDDPSAGRAAPGWIDTLEVDPGIGFWR